MTYTTREQWLVAGLGAVARCLPDGAAAVPIPPIKVSVGRTSKRTALGECYGSNLSQDDQTYHVFMAPKVTDPLEVLHVLLHELIHAVVGVKAGHKGQFIRLARLAGLVKPWTATTPGPALTERLNAIAAELGPYPHVALNLALRKKQGTRMRLYECSHGKKVRTTVSEPLNAVCLDCGTPFAKVTS